VRMTVSFGGMLDADVGGANKIERFNAVQKSKSYARQQSLLALRCIYVFYQWLV